VIRTAMPATMTADPVQQEIRTVTWEQGKKGDLVTWSLGKLGVIADEATTTPREGETWVVRVVLDTAPGERKGVLVLDPIRLDGVAGEEVDDPVDEGIVEQAGALVDLAAVSLCPTATVTVEREAPKVIRYKVHVPEGEESRLIGLHGNLAKSLTTLVTHILVRTGVRCWLDVETYYAKCECGGVWRDPLAFTMGTAPGGPDSVEERFEAGQPVRYAARLCGKCRAPVFVKVTGD